MEILTLETLTTKYINMAVEFAPKLVAAVFVLFAGLWFIKLAGKIIAKFFDKKDYDVSLETFLQSLINIGLKIVLFVSVAGMVGFPTSSLFAIMGAAGLAVGLALQGSLSNFAGGVLILIFKPYKVGELVTLLDKFGEVMEIQIFNTIIKTYDSKIIILPNGAVSNGVIQNHSREGKLMADLRIKVDFATDIDNLREKIVAELLKDEKVLKSPAPTVNVLEYAEGGVVLCVRPHAAVADYWDVHFKSLENLQKLLRTHKIAGPKVTRFVNSATITD
jgi:small conductance mechanosensitive channel